MPWSGMHALWELSRWWKFVEVSGDSNLQNEAHKDEQRSRRRTPGGSAHVTTNTRVSKGSAAEGRMVDGGGRWMMGGRALMHAVGDIPRYSRVG